jgi:hypothetical protein
VEDWIRRQIERVAAPIRRAVDWVTDRIASVWHTTTRVMGQVKNGATHMRDRIIHFGRSVRNLGSEIWSTLKWLRDVLIPRWVRWALAAAGAYTRGLIGWLRGLLSATIRTLDRWAKAAVKRLDDLRKAFSKWATDAINALRAWVAKVSRTILPLFTAPIRLVEWLWAALVGKFWRWLPTQRDRIANWVLNRSLTATLWFARQAANVIGRLL